MTDLNTDKRIVMTLDAGGTNFVFSAMQGNKQVVEPITLASNADNLDKCLSTLVEGFTKVRNTLISEPVAISFAFPGPADYANGIIGDLPNLPAFRGGIPLGPFLHEKFNLPVFINNDGDLFAYGEALMGMLPAINEDLKAAGSTKCYKNLIGLTLGTGFGAGLVADKRLILGDNGIASEIWLLSNRVNPDCNIEEVVSTRSIIATYKEKSESEVTDLLPYDIFQIAKGEKPGDKNAAIQAFQFFGRGIGDAIANLITLFDGLVVIGGGITGAKELYMPSVMEELNRKFINRGDKSQNRLVQKVYDYSNNDEKEAFLSSYAKPVLIPGSQKTVNYDAESRVAIAHSQLGASKAIQLGAYVFALENI